MRKLPAWFAPALLLVLVWGSARAAGVPADIQTVFNKPLYRGAAWGLRVLDRDSGRVLIDLNPHRQFHIGSVRKIFTVGELLDRIGGTYRYNTPVYRQGKVDSSGVLHGNLIVVASGDLTMGGRTNPDGTIAVTDFDHNEADSLGNAILSRPDPLAGYDALAHQVAAAGIRQVADVVIDDRLFKPFDFRGQFDVKPIFVNDDVVDLTINPSAVGQPASVKWRPVSAALGVENRLLTGASGSDITLQLDPELPACIGSPGCTAAVKGNLPLTFVPPLTNRFPLVRTIRIVQPSNYARTVFIQALQRAGVRTGAPAVAPNPVRLLPPRNSYKLSARVARLTGMRYSEDAKLILKVSYNIGADTSLVLFGLTKGVNNLPAALAAERTNLSRNYGIAPSEYRFVDGSGGGETAATTAAVTRFLMAMTRKPEFAQFHDALPILAVDGSLGFVKAFQSNAAIAGAAGQVRAKTGTWLLGSSSGLMLKGQAFAGYINTRRSKHLIYELVVNDVRVKGLNDVLEAFQDEGTISAMLWHDN